MSSQCPFCEGALEGDLLVAREMMFGMEGRFRYRRCVQCEALVLLDVPESMAPYYPPSYYSLVKFSVAEEHRFLIAMRRLRTNVLLRAPVGLVDRVAERGHGPEFVRWLAGRGLSTRASVLDVGSGNGGLLVDMARNGFTRLLGIDPYLEGSRTLGCVRLEPRTVDEVVGNFDIVTVNHAFEHLSGARQVLGAVRRLLAPGGTVVIRTPVADSSASRRYGANWAQLDAPRHLAIPTEAGMAAVSSAVGLRLLRSYRDGTGFQFWGSEQYGLQIPLSAPQSWTEDRAASPFTQSQVDAWEDQAKDLNKRGEGDSATFVLTHSSESAPQVA